MILGGAGFIGSHLTDAYLRAGTDKVVTVDNLSMTPDLYNLQFARNHKNDRHTFYLANALDLNIMRKVINLERPDVLVDCTGSTAAHCALHYDGKLLDNVSSYTLIGLDGWAPDKELTKIIRLDKVFGGRQFNGPVPFWSLELLKGNELSASKKPPRQLSPFENAKVSEWTYIADLIRAMCLIIDKGTEDEYLVSSGWPATEAQMQGIMSKIARKPDVLESNLETHRKARGPMSLGWKPTRSLEESLEATMAWYQLNSWAFRQDR